MEGQKGVQQWQKERLQANPRKSAAGPLFKGLRPLEGQKGAQQWQKERLQANPRKSAARPLFKGLKPLEGQKGVQQPENHERPKRACQTPFLPDFGRWVAKKGPKKP